MIPYDLYFEGKASFAGLLISSILYGACKMPLPKCLPVRVHFVRSILGIIIALFFQCTASLFDSNNRRGEPIKWGLVAYTVVMFSVATVQTAMSLDILSISYIDNREFPGNVMFDPGPWGYQFSISPEALSIFPNVMFTLSDWLADGLLVRSFLGAVFVQVSNAAPSLALSLLRDLLQEPLGHRHSLHHVPRLRWCVFGSSTDRW